MLSNQPTKRMNESKLAFNLSPKRQQAKALPWGAVLLRQEKTTIITELELVETIEELKYKHFFNDDNEAPILKFDKQTTCFLTSYIKQAYVNNKLMKKDNQYEIKDRDTISIMVNNRIFCFEIKLNNNYNLLNNVKQDLTCGICNRYCQGPITLSPCLHTFCTNCIIKHYKQNLKCFTCDQEISKAHSFLLMNQLCNQFIGKKVKFVEPCFDKLEDDLNQLEEFIKKYFNLKATVFYSDDLYTITFKRNRPGIKSIDLDYNNNNKEYKLIELNLNGNLKCDIKVDINSYNQYTNSRDKIQHNYKCSYCLPVNPNKARFQCNYNTQHMNCRLCNNKFPEPLVNGNCCSLCDVSYCPDCYDIMNSLDQRITLLNWTQYQPTNFPEVWFDGNEVDSQIFQNYINAQLVTPSQFYHTLVDKAKTNNLGIQDFKFNQLTLHSQVCNPCAKQLFNELAFHFRVQMTNAELAPYQEDPKLVREDCSYGRHCSYKLVVEGNENYNHACHPYLISYRRRDAKLAFNL